MSDGEGGVRSFSQAGGEVPALRPVHCGLPALLLAHWPPALGAQGPGVTETDQAGILLLSGGEHSRGLRHDQLPG